MMKKMSTVGVAAVMIASQTMAGDAVQWRVEDGGNGHWYAVIVSSTNNDWDVAKLAAESTGGHLMCLETTDEKSFAFASFTPTAYPSAWVNQENGTNINPNFGPWIGGTQEAASAEPLGGWRWISGPNFDPAEVWCCNNDCSGTNEDRLHLYSGGGISWNDLPNQTNCGYAPNSYVIEWSADCNNDGIVDYGQCQDGSLVDTNTNNIPDCCDGAIACSTERQVPSQYATIQAAINAAANGDQVVVAPGTYHEQINLGGKDIRLTGALGADKTIIDGQDQGTVIVGSGEPATCVISGFTIMNGIDVSYSGGGGIALSGSSLRLAKCVIRNNTADGPAWWSGGGFHSVGGAPTIEDCLFVNNRSNDQSSASAIYHHTGGSITVRRCTFDGNTGNYSGGNGSGPGHTIKCHSEYSALTVSIEECTFIRSTTGTATPLANVGGEILLNASGLECDVRACYFVAGYSGALCAVSVAGGANALVSNSSICGYTQPIGGFGGGITIVDCLVGSICADCDQNNIDDVLQIASGRVQDGNQNNIPDTCECIGDIDLDGVIGGSDLGIMLAYWGPVTTESVSLASDLNADGFVNGSDLGVLLAHWGACQG